MCSECQTRYWKSQPHAYTEVEIYRSPTYDDEIARGVPMVTTYFDVAAEMPSIPGMLTIEERDDYAGVIVGHPPQFVRDMPSIPGSIKKPRGRPRHADPSPDALRHRKHYAKKQAERYARHLETLHE